MHISLASRVAKHSRRIVTRCKPALVVIVLAWELTACGGSARKTSAPTPPPNTSTQATAAIAISVTPAAATLLLGGQQSFSATISGSQDKRVAWTVQELEAGTIDASGNFSAAARSGVVHVIARSVADSTKQAVATVQVNDYTGSSSATGALAQARANHTATLLPDGKVLIAGGMDAQHPALDSAELYDPATGKFEAVGPMRHARSNANAVVLNDGKVLILGGCGTSGPQVTAEVFDPATREFSSAFSLDSARCGGTASLLANGKVLITGNGDTAELYDPAGGATMIKDSMQRRIQHSASVLTDGKVLLAGGMIVDSKGVSTDQLSDRIEIFDPIDSRIHHEGALATKRAGHSANVMADGPVLLAGGSDDDDSAELADGKTQSGAVARDVSRRSFHTATMLSDGRVLIVGGTSSRKSVQPTSSISIFNGQFRALGDLQFARTNHTTTRLQDGRLLVVGGLAPVNGHVEPVANAELIR